MHIFIKNCENFDVNAFTEIFSASEFSNSLVIEAAVILENSFYLLLIGFTLHYIYITSFEGPTTWVAVKQADVMTQPWKPHAVK